jgi:ABC-type glycerol-3-phosphate transport system substrate-binding protein
MRLFYRFLIFLIIFTGACENKRVEKGTSISNIKEPVPLNFIGHWLDEGKKEQMLYELINEFEFLNQDIQINMKFPSYYSNMSEAKFNAQVLLSPKMEWDIIRINNDLKGISAEIKEPGWEKKYLVDFSEIEEFRNNTKSDLLTEEAKSKFGGIMPGPGIDGYNWTLWCNTDIAKKVGIDVKQFDMTSEDFLSYLRAVHEYNQAHNDSIIAFLEASDWTTINTIAGELFMSEIGEVNEIMDVKYSEKKIKAWSKVLHEIEIYSKCKPMPRNRKNFDWIGHRFYPVEDKCLFFSNGTWMYNIWLKEYPDRIKKMMPTEMPVFKPSPMTFGGYNITWAVPKNAPHKDQAIKFLLFINRPDVAEKWSRYTKSPSGIKARMTDAYFGLDRFENYQYIIEKKYKGNKIDLTSDSRFFYGYEFRNILTYTDNVFSGEITADQAVKRIKDEIAKQRLLKRN